MSSSAQDSVNDEWNSMAGEWDDLARGYRDAFIKLLWEQTTLSPSEERVVLDFGCGSGLLTEAMRKSSPRSQFFCIDAASSMIQSVKDKMRSGDWTNVKAYCVALCQSETAPEDVRADLEALRGKVDLVVASSVLNFVPSADLPATMKTLSEMLKPGGIFCHSDWPKSEESPDGFNEEKAEAVYKMGGLMKERTNVFQMEMGGHKGDVFIGVAVKK